MINTVKMKACVFDECCFYKENLIVMIFVDDMLPIGLDEEINKFSTLVKKKFKVTESNINEKIDFLGCTIEKTADGIFHFNQTEYVHKLLKKYLKEKKTKSTPLPINFLSLRRQDKSGPVNLTDFQQKLGALGFLRSTRFDLLYSLNQLSRFGQKPTEFALNCLNHVLFYLNKHPDVHLRFYPKNESTQLIALVDAAFANNNDFHSTSGYFIYYGNTLIGCNSTAQKRVVTSSAEAELTEIYRSSKVLLEYKGLLSDLKQKVTDVIILTDSSSSIQTLNNPISSRYRFLSIYIAFVKQLFVSNDFKIHFINRENNFADVLGKQNVLSEFQRYWNMAFSPFKWIFNREGTE